MKNKIIIIAIVFDERNGTEKVIEEFETEMLIEAFLLFEQKYQGFDIEYLYVFDSILNQLDRIKLLLNVNSK